MNARLVWAVLSVGSVSSIAGCGLTLDNDPPDVEDAGTFGDAQATLDAGDGDGGAPECVDDGDCADGVYCNGEEHCAGGACVAGSDPCGEPPSCTTSTCDEATQACPTTAIACPTGEVCDPGSSTCVPAPDCTSDLDCPNDGIDCNGSNVCVDGSCVTSPDVIACADLDSIDCTVPTCAVDGCVEMPVDSLCDDPFPSDCMVPHCSGSGCILIPSDDACDDGVACTLDVCVVPSDGAPAVCQHQASSDPTICDDGAACTHDSCSPTAPTRDPSGCVHQPDDSVCAAGADPACGFAVCAGAEALRLYPMLGGCAPNLNSEACGVGAVHCVPSPTAGALCAVFADGCSTDRDCDDGNPCNGREGCAAGRCARLTTGCPPMPCTTPWCDLTSTPSTCRYRPEPACTAG